MMVNIVDEDSGDITANNEDTQALDFYRVPGAEESPAIFFTFTSA